MLGVAFVVAGLSTGNKIGLAVVGGAFILFALLSSFVFPARYPDFPGKHVGWYVVAGICFFPPMITAVVAFRRGPTRGGVPPKNQGAQTTPRATTTLRSTTGASPP